MYQENRGRAKTALIWKKGKKRKTTGDMEKIGRNVTIRLCWPYVCTGTRGRDGGNDDDDDEDADVLD